MLFGTAGTDPYLPLPNAIKTMFAGAEPGALELSTIVPADGAANVAIDANIVLTFNNEIRTEAVVVTKNDGTIVAGAKTWDATGKILTFNPTANLDNSGDYIVTIGGVSDIYGQVLAAVVKNFSTVAP
jgi:methionine-rich copper-binding protein CopC